MPHPLPSVADDDGAEVPCPACGEPTGYARVLRTEGPLLNVLTIVCATCENRWTDVRRAEPPHTLGIGTEPW